MHSTVFALAVLACLLATVWAGRAIARRLPQEHLSGESKDIVKLAMGLVATMAALLLGLLISSAKNAYEVQRDEITQIAARIVLLDRMLELYGPEAAPLRAKFQATVRETVQQLWPQMRDAPRTLHPTATWGHGLYLDMLALEPHNRVQRGLRKQALLLAVDVGRLRSLLLSQSVPGVSTPLVAAVVGWLVIIFLGFSVIAPRNQTTTLALALSALSAAMAIFLIMELDRPFGGWIEVPGESLRLAAKQIGL